MNDISDQNQYPRLVTVAQRSANFKTVIIFSNFISEMLFVISSSRKDEESCIHSSYSLIVSRGMKRRFPHCDNFDSLDTSQHGNPRRLIAMMSQYVDVLGNCNHELGPFWYRFCLKMHLFQILRLLYLINLIHFAEARHFSQTAPEIWIRHFKDRLQISFFC